MKRRINNKTGVLAIILGISLAILFGNTTVSEQLPNILLLIALCLGISFLLLSATLLANPQKWTAREADNMLRLIRQGAVQER